MLPQFTLDDERFAEIAERARNGIERILPEWTDHNLHDPGITVLELFAWMKEMQQFHMDQITKAHRLSYLHLMGAAPETIKAAEAVVVTDGAEHPVFFPRGSRFYAGEICFEAVTEIRAGAAEITGLSPCSGQEGTRGKKSRTDAGFVFRKRAGKENEIWAYHETVRRGKTMHVPAFGDTPGEESVLRMEVSAALQPYVTHGIHIRLAQREAFRRNPIGEYEAFYPLAELSLWYQGEGGIRRAEIVEDTTHGLLEDGWIRFRLGGKMKAENGFFYLYLTPDRCEYEVPPLIAGISLHEQSVVQKRTIAEYHDGTVCGGEPIRISTYLAMTGDFLLFRRKEYVFVLYDGKTEKRVDDESAFFFLPEIQEGEEFSYRLIFSEAGGAETLRIGEGCGLPEQVFVPQIPGLCAEGMCLMMEQGKGSGRYVSAERCQDFMQAGACDAVFQYEEERGSICFGDCDHGMAPEGTILFASAQSSLGAGGNVKAGSICRLEDGERQLFVTNEHGAAGGKNAETLSECGERLRKLRDRTVRAVTDEDFERLVMQTPGLMLKSVKVIRGLQINGKQGGGPERQENCVTIVVKPCSVYQEAYVSDAYRKNILRMLEPRRLIGTRILVISPEYIGISLFGEIVVNGQKEAAKACIKAALDTFFAKIGTEFGAPVRMSAVYGILDVLDVTARIVSLTLNARGKGVRRNRSGDLLLPANGLAYLKECELNMTAGG